MKRPGARDRRLHLDGDERCQLDHRTSGASGTVNGLVQFVAAPNDGPARTGTLTIAGRRYVVMEAGR
jgi:hypothetical protein